MAGTCSSAVYIIFIGLSWCHLVVSDVSFTEAGYLQYKQDQVTSQYNEFEVTFKTIDGTGVILGATSKRNDYLTIELVRGKIRYAGEFGKGTRNIDKQIAGYHDLFVGIDFADNRWHTVKVTQNVRDVTVLVDGVKTPKTFAFVKAPPAPTDFSIDMMFVTNLPTFKGVSEERSMSQKGLAACIRSATFRQGGRSTIDLLTQTNILKIGSTDFCPEIDYRPMFFPNKVAHLAQPTYKENNLKVSFDFRTNIPEQVVMNHTNTAGHTVEILVSRKGKLVLQVSTDQQVRAVQTGGSKIFHDGLWHKVEFLIGNVSPDYQAEFTVDGVRRLTTLGSAFVFDGPLHYGFGFTGCMRNLMLNNQVQDTSLLMNTAVQFNKCILKDFCTPNPCINGGKCNQTDFMFFCDCREIAYTGSTCSESRFNHTCLQVKEKGEIRSDTYYIDLDGLGDLPPIKAYCEIGRTPEETITQINTTIPYDVVAQNPTGLKFQDISYTADEESLREVILHSAKCEQLVRYRCTRSYLFRSPRGPPQARWLGFDDVMHYYWGGSGGKRGYCACGVENNCVDRSRYCNCDSRRNAILEDRGYLTIKNHLPIRRVELYDVDSNNGGEGLLTVGPLRCRGYGGREIGATFREPYSYIEVEATDDTMWNNALDASGIWFEFKTTLAKGIMTHSRGPVSGDYLTLELVSRTRARVTMNIGYKDLIQDVDISPLDRVFDDNEFHSLKLDFNRRELNFTVDNITRTLAFHYQYGITHLNLDGAPFYVGGSAYNENGFMGCIRNWFLSGKLFNLSEIAVGQERYGVYPGCGAACKLVRSPCNQGFCIDQFNNYTCNCTVSPFYGRHCQLENTSLILTPTDSITYSFGNTTTLGNVYEGIFTLAFKTKQRNVLLAQIAGDESATPPNNAHISMVLIDGTIRLLFNFSPRGTAFQTIIIRPIYPSTGFDDDKTHIIRAHHKDNKMFFSLLDDPNNPRDFELNITESLDFLFPNPQSIRVGTFGKLSSLPSGLPTSFDGCMPGVKYHYNLAQQKIGIAVDVFKQFDLKSSKISSTGSPRTGNCSTVLAIPDPIPTVIPPPQFNLEMSTTDTLGPNFTDNVIVVVIVVAILVIFCLVVIAIILNYVNRNRGKYQTEEDKRPLTVEEHWPMGSMKQTQPVSQPSSVAAPITVQAPPPTSIQLASEPAGAVGGGSKDEWFI